jgi:hypothetical protein
MVENGCLEIKEVRRNNIRGFVPCVAKAGTTY